MLTQVAVQAAKPREKAYKLSDGNGLHLLVETSGSKLWRFRYQFERKEKMLSFGSFPEVTIAQARQKRDDARAVLATGIDPARKRELDRIAASMTAANTFGLIVTEYLGLGNQRVNRAAHDFALAHLPLLSHLFDNCAVSLQHARAQYGRLFHAANYSMRASVALSYPHMVACALAWI